MKVWKPLLLIAVLGATTAAAGAEAQRLTAYERAQGWRLLFDGRTLENWRGYRISKLPDCWQARDGNLVGHGGTPLTTEERFGDFELTFDWCVVESGTAEVYFHVWEDSAAPGDTGPVMQLAGHGGGSGANGGLSRPVREVTPQPGTWYRAKIAVFGYQVEYWINGEKILAYTIDDREWRAAVAGSPHRDIRDYALQRDGHLVLAGSGVSFRNIKMRPL